MTRADQPLLVTTAPESPRDELRRRQRRYLITMGFRVICIVLAILLAALHLDWEAGIAVAGSLILPWVAVIAANAGPQRTAGAPLVYEPERRQLPK